MTRIIQSEKGRQQTWAHQVGLKNCYSCDYVEPDDNIFGRIEGRVRSSLGSGDGGELKKHPKTGRAKMGALHSSSALGINVFQHWLVSADDRGPLERALNLPAAIIDITFEQKFPTGVRGKSPNLDVALWLADGTITAIESKYLEPFSKHQHGLKDTYFAGAPGDFPRWNRQGLAAHQAVADEVRSGSSGGYTHLHAEQLLKHALGLARSQKLPLKREDYEYKATELIYVYFRPVLPADDGREDDHNAVLLHDAEVALYSRRIDGDSGTLRFRGMTYQNLFGKLRWECGDDPRHADYLRYLELRYFGTPAASAVED